MNYLVIGPKALSDRSHGDLLRDDRRDEQTAVLENPDHDFAKVIAYRLAADEVLTVGVTDGPDGGSTLR